MDIIDSFLPDISVPEDGDIGVYATLTSRNDLVQNGSSTVIINQGQFQVQSFLTGFRPVGDPPTFARTLVQDYNIAFRVLAYKNDNVIGKAIATSDQVVYSR